MDESGWGLIGAGAAVVIVAYIVQPSRYGAIGKAIPPAMLIAATAVSATTGRLLAALILAVVTLFVVVSLVMRSIDRAGLD